MSKEDLIGMEGKITSQARGNYYTVELENGPTITARLCGKMKNFNIRVLVGDRVVVSVSPYDPSHGLITHRHK